MPLRHVLRRGLVGRRRDGLRVVDLQHGARSGVGGGGMLGDDPRGQGRITPSAPLSHRASNVDPGGTGSLGKPVNRSESFRSCGLVK